MSGSEVVCESRVAAYRKLLDTQDPRGPSARCSDRLTSSSGRDGGFALEPCNTRILG